jgi:hypothetical protein
VRHTALGISTPLSCASRIHFPRENGSGILRGLDTTMADTGTNPVILWDTLKLSAKPLWGRSDILVVAQVKVQEDWARRL